MKMVKTIQAAQGASEGAQESAQEDYSDMSYKKGGIHIKPSHRGRFTEYKKRTGKTTEEALHSKDPHVRQMANFARNAAKWKHEDGGYAMPAYGYGSAGVQPQGAQTNSQAYTIQRGVAVPMPTRAYGGYYQEGGEAMPQEMMEGAPQQMQEQAMGQEQQQGGQDQMMQQLMQMVMQALQEGMQPEQIMQMLVQQGVPEDVAMQVIQMVMQQMGGAPQGGPGEQYQSQGEQYQGPQAMAAYGGMYQIGGVTPHGAGTHGQQYTIKNGVAIPMGAYGGYYADGGFFNESYMPFDY